uniref:GRF-type domain-containing protein n=1 Tax=Lactuca sativa TaxID=4236 RepID=A0A9R1WKA0_LACSA|nr:hypothetical protein LSAT_V11C100044930 [Lactuca sativa]
MRKLQFWSLWFAKTFGWGPKSFQLAPKVQNQEAATKVFFFFVSHLLLLLQDSKIMLCFYGNVAVVRTSWTSQNPGRRFYACLKMVSKLILGSRYGFLGWVDPPMCQRSTVIIPGLLRTMNSGSVEDVFAYLVGLVSVVCAVLELGIRV